MGNYSYLADKATEAVRELVRADSEDFTSALTSLSRDELERFAIDLAQLQWNLLIQIRKAY